MKKIYSLLFVALLLAACSDNSSSANEEAENTQSTQESEIFIFGSDYTTGELYINSTEQSNCCWRKRLCFRAIWRR